MHHTQRLSFSTGGGGAKKDKTSVALFSRLHRQKNFLNLAFNLQNRMFVFRTLQRLRDNFSKSTCLYFSIDMKACSVVGAEHSLGGRSRAWHCMGIQSYRNAWLAILWDVLHVQCGSSSGLPLLKRTARNSVNVSDQAPPVYYLPWFHMARSGSGSAAITVSMEGPRDSDLPAATAARSSLLSAPITGASVPT